MTQEIKQSAITIDGNNYALDDLSAHAQAQIINLRVTDQEIARLQTQLAIAQTARAAYAQALATELQSEASPQKSKQK